MSGRFKVECTFSIVYDADQRLFVMAGDVAEGAVSAGMRVDVPGAVAGGLDTRIHSVGFMCGEHCKVALHLLCQSPAELDIWRGLGLDGETIDVTEMVEQDGRADPR